MCRTRCRGTSTLFKNDAKLAVPATPTITAGGPVKFCQGGSVILTSSDGTSYLWSNGAITKAITVTTSGNYSVQVTNLAGCQSLASTAETVTVNTLPTTSVAGLAQTQCETTTATLAGNTAVVGTGKWTLESGSGTITTSTSPTSGVTGLGYGANVFRWTISNGTCAVSAVEARL